MFEITVIVCSVITLILLKIFLNINFKVLKGLKNRTSNELENLSKRFPNDEKICKDILKKLNNDTDVKLKTDKEYNSCLYTVFNNTIIIGKFKQNYMKIQTITHECIHSCQNKKTLWSNFIFTNIYLLYFTIILILEIVNCLLYKNIFLVIFIFLSFIQYVIRFSLENEAMIKARFIAKEYIEENDILTKEEIQKLLVEYDKINSIGIPFINYYTISSNIIKIIIFCITILV